VYRSENAIAFSLRYTESEVEELVLDFSHAINWK